MKINLFKNWQRVEDELYTIWCMHQSDIMLPRFMDNDFKKCFENVKRQYGYNNLVEKLGLH